MPFSRAAFIAVISLWAGVAGAQQSGVLTIEQAFARTLERHPALARLSHTRDTARAVLDAESQRPPLRMEFEVENAPQTESTLSLASVFEAGGKRDARRAVANASLDALTLQEQRKRADLLAEVARRYLDLVAAQSLADFATRDMAQREKAVTAASQRVRAGATPESVRLSAEAALIRATLQRDRASAQARVARLSLAILWGSREPNFERVTGDPLAIPAVPTVEALRALLERSPELAQFADATRLQEARLQLARSARAMDIEWRVGVRRLQEDESWTAVVGVSVPLGNSSRAEPGIRAAQSELLALSLERDAETLTLEATLIDAHQRLSGASAEVSAAREFLLPKLEEADRASERAFRAGALTYSEWSQVQSETAAARREQLLAAIEAHRALIEIQRLTGSPFITGQP